VKGREGRGVGATWVKFTSWHPGGWTPLSKATLTHKMTLLIRCL